MNIKKIVLYLMFVLSILVLGEENYKSLYLVAPKYKEVVKTSTASIDSDEVIKARQKMLLQFEKNNKTKPSQKIVVPASKG